MPTDNKLRVSIKFGDIEATYKISENKSAEIFRKIKDIIDPTGMITESQLED